MIKIDLLNKTKFKISVTTLEKFLQKAERVLKLKGQRLISLSLVGETEIRKLNKLYRHRDKITDVLSFEERVNFPHQQEYLGDILICAVVARRQAEKMKYSFKKEIERLTLHGFLHLLGFDHVREKEAREMERIEETVIS